MDRPDDIMIPAQTSWLCDEDAQAVCRAIAVGGHQILFVGGCVRNALLGLAGTDVDMSTDALPKTVMSLAQEAGLKAIPTGIEHGTVTVVAGGKPFEITTFRRDVETDGRRAVVAFADNIEEDARRRDFTINALYATPKGQVLDPLGGLPDLKARQIRFIEDASARIKEDYLRILRFFRFSAWYGDPLEGFDPNAIDAIAQNVDGIESLSAERIGQEMRKLLLAPLPGMAIAGMRSTGTLQIVLPGADDRWIVIITHFESELGLSADWICRLVALGGEDVVSRLRLSKADARKYDILREVAFDGKPLAEIAYRHGQTIAERAMILRGALSESMPDSAELETILAASTMVFPVRAADLMPDLNGRALGKKLAELERIWIASGFEMTKAELLDLS